MKMPIQSYDMLVEALRPHDTPDRRRQYLTGQFQNSALTRDLDKRYRWDLLWAHNPFKSAQEMYANGLSDEHFDTALRKFIPPLDKLERDGKGGYLYQPVPEPQPSAEQLTHEQRVAVREAEEIHASDEFFKARPGMDSLTNRNLFRHGYFRGYDKGQGKL